MKENGKTISLKALENKNGKIKFIFKEILITELNKEAEDI